MKFHRIAKLAVVLLGILFLISIYCINSFDVYVVDGNSMRPTLTDGDIVIIKKTDDITDGDIVVIATEGVYSDVGYEYIIKRYDESKSTTGIYVTGDNAEDSVDSREFGEIPFYMLKGKVICQISR